MYFLIPVRSVIEILRPDNWRGLFRDINLVLDEVRARAPAAGPPAAAPPPGPQPRESDSRKPEATVTAPDGRETSTTYHEVPNVRPSDGRDRQGL